MSFSEERRDNLLERLQKFEPDYWSIHATFVGTNGEELPLEGDFDDHNGIFAATIPQSFVSDIESIRDEDYQTTKLILYRKKKSTGVTERVIRTVECAMRPSAMVDKNKRQSTVSDKKYNGYVLLILTEKTVRL